MPFIAQLLSWHFRHASLLCDLLYHPPPLPSGLRRPNPPAPLPENPVLPPYRARIEEMGFKPEKVAELVSRTFNEMIFIHGDVHCDPHAANLFLRKDEVTGQLQLVLLDHGLYRQVLACNPVLATLQPPEHIQSCCQFVAKGATSESKSCRPETCMCSG